MRSTVNPAASLCRNPRSAPMTIAARNQAWAAPISVRASSCERDHRVRIDLRNPHALARIDRDEPIVDRHLERRRQVLTNDAHRVRSESLGQTRDEGLHVALADRGDRTVAEVLKGVPELLLCALSCPRPPHAKCQVPIRGGPERRAPEHRIGVRPDQESVLQIHEEPLGIVAPQERLGAISVVRLLAPHRLIRDGLHGAPVGADRRLDPLLHVHRDLEDPTQLRHGRVAG